MPKTALEVIVSQNTKDISDMQLAMKDFSHDMVDAINGLRKDMSDRGEKMIQMLNDQNLMLVKSQSAQQTAIVKELTDHKSEDATMFASINTKLAYWVGGGTAIMGLISIGIAIFK